MSTPYQPRFNREQSELSNRIGQELRRLRILTHLRGYYYLTYILLQVVPDPGWLILVTKNLYPETGRAFGVSPGRVERTVRTAVSRCWEHGGRDVLNQMADCHLVKRPTNTEFIGIVADYIRHAD